jgi:hypothetical protein
MEKYGMLDSTLSKVPIAPTHYRDGEVASDQDKVEFVTGTRGLPGYPRVFELPMHVYHTGCFIFDPCHQLAADCSRTSAHETTQTLATLSQWDNTTGITYGISSHDNLRRCQNIFRFRLGT